MNLISPEQLELEKRLVEIASLEKQLAEKELELHQLQSDLGLFNIRYKSQIGRLYAELDEVNAEIARLDAIQNPTPEVKAFADEAIRQAKQSAFEAGISEEEEKRANEIPAVQTDELKQLFKKAAMKFHPDRTTDDAEKKRRTELMSLLNKAYDVGDIEAIKKLINDASVSPDEITGNDVGSKLVKVIRQQAQIENRLVEIDKNISIILKSEEYLLMSRVKTQEASGLNPLGSLAEEINQEISAQKTVLQKMKLAMDSL